MRLWMICPADLVAQLEAAGELTLDWSRSCDAADFPVQWAWLREAMRRRVPGYGGSGFWWGWHTLHGVAGKRPDLRDRQRWHWWTQEHPPGTRWARLGLEVTDAEALISDFFLWAGIVLNNGYVGYTEAEDATWHAEHPHHPSGYNAATRATLEESWDRIFTTEQGQFDPNWAGTIAEDVQGTFELLRWRDVREITYFISRPMRENLPDRRQTSAGAEKTHHGDVPE